MSTECCPPDGTTSFVWSVMFAPFVSCVLCVPFVPFLPLVGIFCRPLYFNVHIIDSGFSPNAGYHTHDDVW